MPVTYCDVFGYLWRSIQAMSCFFDCFGIRNNHRSHRLPHSPTPNPTVVVQEEAPQKIRLSSLFAAEEREEFVVKDSENETLVRRPGRSEVNDQLVEVAKFLKACGTLPETPAEIRKRVTIVENLEKSDIQRPHNVHEFSPETPVEIQQAEYVAENLERSDLNSAPSLLDSSPETPDEIREVGTVAEKTAKLDGWRPCSAIKSSPYQTPRVITDDMQTPGTVFATNMKSLSKGNGRIRSQYVHTVLNPIENLFQLDELKEENSVLAASDHEGDVSEQGNATPFSGLGSNKKDVQDETLGDVSLSAWLKPPPSKQENDYHNPGAARHRKPIIGKTSIDRPIIGLVAAHWNDHEEASHISPKGWDGNGIPNSTTKYKEDQKVCWHATPFEERLEKALSEETFAPQRKPIIGAPISFEENEGQDTATSQLRQMNSPKSVVSF